jgi:lysophospholipase L1-like esterase
MKSYPVKKVADVIARMKAGKKVSIICTGDSITAGTSIKDADLNRYGVKLQNKLRKAFNNNNIDVEVVAVGGARTFDLRVWAERDFGGKKPDLVTVMIGYNDKSSQSSPDYYYGSLSRAVDRILGVTEGSPAILLLPPIPGQGARYNMMDDYAEVRKKLARDRKLEFFEMAPAFKKLPLATFTSYFADMAHPNADGHEFIAQQITGYLTR